MPQEKIPEGITGQDTPGGPGRWKVTRDSKGKLIGLPDGIFEADVITFWGKDGKLYAERANRKRQEEKDLWGTS